MCYLLIQELINKLCPTDRSVTRNVICQIRYMYFRTLDVQKIPGLPKSCKSVHLSTARTVPLTVVSEQVWNKPSWWYWTPSISLSSCHQTRQKSVARAKTPSRIAARQLTKLVITLIIICWQLSYSQSFPILLRRWVCQLTCEEFATGFIEMHAFHLCSLHFTHNNILRMILELAVRWFIGYSYYNILTNYSTEIKWNKTWDKFTASIDLLNVEKDMPAVNNRALYNSVVGQVVSRLYILKE